MTRDGTGRNAVSFLSFFKRSGKKTSDEDSPETDEDSPETDEDSPEIDEDDEDAEAGTPKIPLRLRFKACWEGEDAAELMAREASDSTGDEDSPESDEGPPEMDEGDEEGEEAPKVPLRLRFKAWWEGEDAAELMAREASDSTGDEDSPESDEGPPEMDEGDEEGEEAPKVPLRLRFKAWWEGEDAAELMAREASGESEEDAGDAEKGGGGFSGDLKATKAVPTDPYSSLWSETRLNVAEMVWGEGFLGPGGEEYVHELAIPLALNSKQTVLYLGAGLGGPARYISNEADLWITTMEPCQFLVDAGKEQATMAGEAKKVAMEQVDMEDLELRKNKYNAIFSDKAFFTVRKKNQCFKNIYRALKPKGQFMLIDYMLPKAVGDTVEIKNWILSEEVPPELWSLKQMHDCLEGLGLNIRIEEDITGGFRKRFMVGWGEFLSDLRHKDFHGEGRLAGEKGDLLIKEVER